MTSQEQEMVRAPKCTSWLGHKFEARYTTTNPAAETLIRTSSNIDISGAVLRDMATKTYEGDICTRCGCVVNRPPTPIKERKP